MTVYLGNVYLFQKDTRSDTSKEVNKFTWKLILLLCVEYFIVLQYIYIYKLYIYYM